MDGGIRVGPAGGQVDAVADDGNFEELMAQQAGQEEELPEDMQNADQEVVDAAINQMITDKSIQNMQKNAQLQKEMFDEE